MKINGINNVIFDLDGTLIDSSVGVTEATNYALLAMGEPERNIEEVRKYIGYPLEKMFSDFSDKSYDQFWPLFRKKAKEVIVPSAVALDGADEVLEKLKTAGMKIGIGSTKISPHIDGTIKKMGWTDYINFFVGADQVKNVKPAPDVFLKLLELMNSGKENAVVIGDTINDILAAKAAGIRNIAVRSPYGGDDKLKLAKPDYVADKIKDILDILL